MSHCELFAWGSCLSHYETPPEFFTLLCGGRWHTYSCNLYDGTDDVTTAQEAQLDLLARLMRLQSGQRILEVGCGWGGPLSYLTLRYNCYGVGIAPSGPQIQYCRERAAREGAAAT